MFEGNVDIVNAEGGAKEGGFLMLFIVNEIMVLDAIGELGSFNVMVLIDNPHIKLVADGVTKEQVELINGSICTGKVTAMIELA